MHSSPKIPIPRNVLPTPLPRILIRILFLFLILNLIPLRVSPINSNIAPFLRTKNRNWMRLPFPIALIRLRRDLIQKEIVVITTRCWNHIREVGPVHHHGANVHHAMEPPRRLSELKGAVWGCSWRGRHCLGVFVERKESSCKEEEENCLYEKSEL
ncbi:hypothetical protein LR48_Vigan304s002300 [Vigna angularis]|uniref:Uncharacterized protein n=1 Tax=Phaseolus angularis TaxID=3914 RepID=A0A0L9T8J0_PHAAN|nr:hypothetical protein LR48_Vigan304s002300 [Vigna angularis]